jgi:predicted CoA-binding protein
MTDNELREILRDARTIAVVGCSPKLERPSNGVARYLQARGYRIVPVNPGVSEILGERSYPTVTAAARDHTIDIVDVFRRSEFAGAVVDQALPLAPRLVILQLGVVDHRAAERAAAAGVPMLMDRCLAIEHRRLAV